MAAGITSEGGSSNFWAIIFVSLIYLSAAVTVASRQRGEGSVVETMGLDRTGSSTTILDEDLDLAEASSSETRERWGISLGMDGIAPPVHLTASGHMSIFV